MKWSFRITTILLLLLLVLGIAFMLRPHAVQADVVRAALGPLEEKVVNVGRGRVRERYTVSSPIAGTLARIELHEGDAVEPGMVLARLLSVPSPLLDPRARKVAEQRLASAIDAAKQASATVMRATTSLDRADRDLARMQTLAKDGALSPAQLDQVTADARMKESELASARFSERVTEHDALQARAALEGFGPGSHTKEQFEVTSPVHGLVLHVLHKSEGVVEPGTPLFELGDPDALELVVDVLSQDAVRIRPGMRATLLHWGGEAKLSARVRRVEPSAFTKTSALGVDEQRVNVILDPLDPKEPWRSFGDGFEAEFEITIWSKPDALQVPSSALFRKGGGWAVFVVVHDKATIRDVEVGHRGALDTEVVAGLRPTESVIIHPGAAVHDGATIESR